MVSFTPRPLYPQGKSPWYPLGRTLGRPQSLSDAYIILFRKPEWKRKPQDLDVDGKIVLERIFGK
jgi:hypothetical protein